MKLDVPSAIDPSLPLIAAVSGGSDSVALLHLLHGAGFRKVIVAHVDHQLRDESHQDAAFVRQLAKKMKDTFALKKLSLRALATAKKVNIEGLAREERYRWFRLLKKKYRAPFIVTAHHADDQVETVLLNMIRGCGLEGFSGMSVIEGDIWRPLLAFSKQEMLRHGEEHGLAFVHDRTNDDTAYRRNFLRHKIVPRFKELNPNFLSTMSGTIRVFKQAAEYFQERAQEFLSQEKILGNRYHLSAFLKLHEAEQGEVLRSLFRQIHGHTQDLTQAHLDQILHVLRANVSGKKKEFGPGRTLVRGKGWFEVE